MLIARKSGCQNVLSLEGYSLTLASGKPSATTVEAHPLCTCWLGTGMDLVADFLKPRLTQSHTTIVVPLDKRIIFVRSHNRSESSCWLSEVAQTHDAISGIQFRVGSRGLDERWSLGSVRISRCSSMRERRLRSFAQFGFQFIDTAHIELPQTLAFASSSAR
jgi:hypothetical protein